MSLPDGAEYWWDVKGKVTNDKKTFTHIPDANCGHYHVLEAKKLGNVDCHACLELIKNGYNHGLQEGFYLTHSQRKHKAQQRKQKIFDDEHGRCTCGCRWHIRKNKSNNQEFLGCSNYPKCKNTKNI